MTDFWVDFWSTVLICAALVVFFGTCVIVTEGAAWAVRALGRWRRRRAA